MKQKIFVDGQEGTTGLKIHEYLAKRSDIDWLNIDPDRRKDLLERSRLLNGADIVFLCLPDVAAREAVSLINNEHTRVIDASTAHRTHPDWAYGLPELSPEHREKIRFSQRVTVPGCHATGFITGVYPLVKSGIIPMNYPLTCTSLTGYSGGGKSLINKYENADGKTVNIPRPYALSMQHKHLPEMQVSTGLQYPPAFLPIVADYYKGMGVMVPLFSRFFKKPMNAAQIRDFLAEYYATEKFIRVMPFDAEATLEDGFFQVECCNDTNRIELCVFGTNEQILVVTRFDNLGKGASGAAVQCMNIMMGVDENTGLQS
ncbi:MAG: N-acetyl-gamma-glutamyl-phosphate reductase [Veillonellaceae bacterium]|nr:N-acetyl-gamma-glutamyl-phosphate reductase [Veillonellaceae bacterium]